MWISAVWRCGSLTAMRSPKAFRGTASVLLPCFLHGSHSVVSNSHGLGRGHRGGLHFGRRQPGKLHARAAHSCGSGYWFWPDTREWRCGTAGYRRCRPQWRSRSARPGGWSSRAGMVGLSPSRLEVNSMARISDVAMSMARWTLRHWRRREGPCLRACHSFDGLMRLHCSQGPISFAQDLDAGAVGEQVQGLTAPRPLPPRASWRGA